MTTQKDRELFELHLSMLTDWHVGSGLERPGAEDRLVRRNADDLPFVPAKSLTAMIRDAAEQIAMGQPAVAGESDSNQFDKSSLWYRWVLFLFGDQPNRPGDVLHHDRNHSARISIRPAQFAKELCDNLREPRTDENVSREVRANRRELREALVFTRAGVRIGPNGRAMDGHLRFDEMVRGGVELTSIDCQLNTRGLDEQQIEFAVSFLQLAVTLVDRVGGKRRRGAGRVKVAFQSRGLFASKTNDALADYFEKNPDPPRLPDAEESALNHVTSPLETPTIGDAWQRFPLAIELLTPLMAMERTVGNVVKSLDFVPGTLLLSLIARRLRPVWPEIDSRIVAGDVCVSPATIEIASTLSDGSTSRERGLPTPACLFHPKGSDQWFEQKGQVSNRFFSPVIDEHVKDFRDGYVMPVDGNVLPNSGKPTMIIAPHNTVAEEAQRPSTEVGGVFSYEAIAAGTPLRGELRLRRSVIEQLQRIMPEWRDRVNGQHSLGRSRKDDYGLVKIQVGEGTKSNTDLCADSTPVTELTVWLTSDVLLRDDCLRTASTASDLVVEIAGSLGLTANDVEITSHEKCASAFLRHRRIESWQVSWGLPRPSLVAIAAGSCIRLKRKDGQPFDTQRLATMEQNGIGLRRAEGFGMLLVNHPLVVSQVSDWKAAPSFEGATGSSPKAISPTSWSSSTRKLAASLEMEVWRQRVLKKAVEIATDQDLRQKLLGLTPNQPKPAQAALLRNLLQFGIETPEKKQAVLQRLSHISELRGDRWPAGALKKIQELLEGTTDLTVLFETGDWPRTTTGDDCFRTNPSFHSMAIRIVIDAALKGHQRDLEKLHFQQSANQDHLEVQIPVRSGYGS